MHAPTTQYRSLQHLDVHVAVIKPFNGLRASGPPGPWIPASAGMEVAEEEDPNVAGMTGGGVGCAM